MTLLILAAGMGSRFGGLKQIEPMGPNGEFIIDYSIFDAKRCGFDKVVFVIKEENLKDFKETIGNRIEGHIKVEYAFQKIDDIPTNKVFKRVKPWGTGQAILCAKDYIDDNFAVINADDFYGYKAYKEAYDFLKNAHDYNFGLIGYVAKNTLSENGSVKRAVLDVENNLLKGLTETKMMEESDHLHCISLKDDKEFDIEKDRLVSMSLLLFTPKIFEILEKEFKLFFDNIKNEETDEFLIHDILDKYIKENKISITVRKTDSIWYGVTYKEDKLKVQESIKEQIKNNIYKENLWG